MVNTAESLTPPRRHCAASIETVVTQEFLGEAPLAGGLYK